MPKIKRKAGRPSQFGTIKQNQLKQLVIAGWDDSQVSKFFGVTETTLNNYKKKYPKFFTSLKDWKKEADLKVEKSLYQRAIGYKYDEVVYEKSKIGGLGIKLKDNEIDGIKHCESNKTKVTVKEVVPDVTAQIFWLKNRQPEQWRDVQEVIGKGFGNVIIQVITPKESGSDSSFGISGNRTSLAEDNQRIKEKV